MRDKKMAKRIAVAILAAATTFSSVPATAVFAQTTTTPVVDDTAIMTQPSAVTAYGTATKTIPTGITTTTLFIDAKDAEDEEKTEIANKVVTAADLKGCLSVSNVTLKGDKYTVEFAWNKVTDASKLTNGDQKGTYTVEIEKKGTSIALDTKDNWSVQTVATTTPAAEKKDDEDLTDLDKTVAKAVEATDTINDIAQDDDNSTSTTGDKLKAAIEAATKRSTTIRELAVSEKYVTGKAEIINPTNNSVDTIAFRTSKATARQKYVNAAAADVAKALTKTSDYDPADEGYAITDDTDINALITKVLSDKGYTGVNISRVVVKTDTSASYAGEFTLTMPEVKNAAGTVTDAAVYSAATADDGTTSINKFNLGGVTSSTMDAVKAWVNTAIANKPDFDTVDDNNVATGVDKAAVQAYIQNEVNKQLVKAGSSTSVKIEVGTYVAATHKADGKIAVTITVTNTSKGKTTTETDVETYTTKHSDSQKLKEAVDATTTAASSFDTKNYKKNNNIDPLDERKDNTNYTDATKTYAYSAAKASDKTSVEGAVDKIIATAMKTKPFTDGTSINGETTPTFKITKYTKATNSSEGTAHVVVTYSVSNDYQNSSDPDDDNLTSKVEFDLTFAKLKEKKTTYLFLSGDRYMKLFEDNSTDYSKLDLADSLTKDGNDELVWSSSDPSVAVVDQDGTVYARGLGKTTITVTNKNDSTVSASAKVTVKNNDKYAFKDVQDPDKFYFSPVYWAGDPNVDRDTDDAITSGISSDTFGVNGSVTRAQFITWLYKEAGAPTVNGTVKFTDVSDKAFYHDAVLWATQKGITSGTTATTFSPNAAITRAQAVTFLYKALGKGSQNYGDKTNEFSDVAANAFYAKAVDWAVSNGVTAGTSNTTFSPNQTCTRAQGITFLYRAVNRLQSSIHD